MFRITHISPHIGGGVGSVVRDLISQTELIGIKNNLLCLDQCEENFDSINLSGIKLDKLHCLDYEGCYEVVHNSDILLLHYWNHPLTAYFVSTFKFPPCRLILWCHNSGLYEPHIIPRYICDLALRVVFTSAVSKLAPNLQDQIKRNPEKFSYIHSTRSLCEFHNLPKKISHKFRKRELLYVGTVSETKMHKQSPELFGKLLDRGYSIKIVGGPHHEELKNKTSGDIKILGPQHSVIEFYNSSSLFIYPLRNDHYGTGEQVILEAMASSLPVIAYNNLAEKEIVAHGVTGFLVDTVDEFVEMVEDIFSDFQKYQLFSKNSSQIAYEKFSVQNMVRQFNNLFNDVVQLKKSKLDYTANSDQVDLALYLYAANSFFDFSSINYPTNQLIIDFVIKKIAMKIDDPSYFNILHFNYKSSPSQYLKYFPESNGIKFLFNNIQSCTIAY